jgi:threonine dehydrogenase-like Zn-dependent dehydrogenase
MVVGCGPIGALAVGVLKRAGAAEIVAVDVHDTPLAIARAVGATRTVNASDADAIAAAEAGVVIECSGSPCGLALAVRGAVCATAGSSWSASSRPASNSF